MLTVPCCSDLQGPAADQFRPRLHGPLPPQLPVLPAPATDGAAQPRHGGELQADARRHYGGEVQHDICSTMFVLALVWKQARTRYL